MFKFIKGLFNKKEIARIKELETEIEKLNAIHSEKMSALEIELEEVRDQSMNLYLELQAIEEEEEIDYSEKCSCGGYMMPMYDEHPNWIKFCSSCDTRTENIKVSPIIEPA